MSAAGSRSTMNTVLESGRPFSSVNWPSTHTVPSLSIHLATLVATARTGHGFSGDWPGSTVVICPAPLGWSLDQLRWGGHLAVARVILLASRVWNGARD